MKRSSMSLFTEQFDHLRIPLKDILQATNNFAHENIIRNSGYGTAYKGELSRPQGIVMCSFERLDRMFGQGFSELWSEIIMLSLYRHENLVSLVGFCDRSDEHILVHEFLTNGSLDRYLSDANLTWLRRVQICLDVARGLDYLHNPPGINRRILHHDLKSANILLDVNWQAKIGDFGLSRFRPENLQHTFLVTYGDGTLGYRDPMYSETGILTKESDVYSFGVVLFEVLCGRLVIADSDGNNTPLTTLAHHHYVKGTLTEIIDPILRKQMNPDSFKTFSDIAYLCLAREQKERPMITKIVKDFETILGLQQEFEKALAIQKVADDLKGREEDDDDCYKVKNMEHMKIPLKEIMLATHNFHDECTIGRGGFGKVYTADLFHFDFRENRDRLLTVRRQSTVAIKRLDRRYGQGTAEFLQEISILPYFRHQNLVTLVGFCDEHQERILLYEYASNGSLDNYIGSTKSLTWAQRLQICLDAAHGLDFLHNGVGEHHRIYIAI